MEDNAAIVATVPGTSHDDRRAPKYRRKCDEVAALGYEGFTLR